MLYFFCYSLVSSVIVSLNVYIYSSFYLINQDACMAYMNDNSISHIFSSNTLTINDKKPSNINKLKSYKKIIQIKVIRYSNKRIIIHIYYL